jgi:RNA polymerase sigma-70 factor, ECF subfamily
MDELPVQQIKDLIRQDDPSALDIVYDTIGGRLARYVLGLLGSEQETEDVMQELFVRLAKQRRRLLNVENMTAYVFAIARNLAWDALNRRTRSAINIDEYRNVFAANNCRANDPPCRAEALEALLTLPFKQREVVNLKCFEDLTFEEIARVLKISANTAASRYRYALDKLRVKLRKFKNE